MTKVCRLCLMKLQRGSKYFNINAVESFTGFMPYRDQLTTCIPEMALDLIPNPVICNNCRTALKAAYDFKSRCLFVEKKIQHYIEGQNYNENHQINYDLSQIPTDDVPQLLKLAMLLPKNEACEQEETTIHPEKFLKVGTPELYVNIGLVRGDGPESVHNSVNGVHRDTAARSLISGCPPMERPKSVHNSFGISTSNKAIDHFWRDVTTGPPYCRWGTQNFSVIVNNRKDRLKCELFNMPAFCSVVGCSKRAERDHIRYFRIPKALQNRGEMLDALSKERRECWVRALRRGNLSDTFLNNARICAHHFVSGEPAKLEDRNSPDWVPSVNMGYTSIETRDEQSVKRHVRLVKRQTKRLKMIQSEEHVPNTDNSQPELESKDSVKNPVTEEESPTTDSNTSPSSKKFHKPHRAYSRVSRFSVSRICGQDEFVCNFCHESFRSLQFLRKHNNICSKSTQQETTKNILTKRPHLPTKAKNHLKKWLFRHTDHPYPTDQEKQMLMQETNLSLLQVENWFINARRRILQDLTKLKSLRGLRSADELCDSSFGLEMDFEDLVPQNTVINKRSINREEGSWKNTSDPLDIEKESVKRPEEVTLPGPSENMVKEEGEDDEIDEEHVDLAKVKSEMMDNR